MVVADNYEVNPFSFTQEQIVYFCGLLNRKKPKNILEYGCGVTTKIFDDYIHEEPNSYYCTVEHDSNYKLNDSVYIFPLIDSKNLNTNISSGLEEFLKGVRKKFDFVVIDGPFGWDQKYDYTRLQMIDPLLFDNLDDDGTFLIHDSQRKSTIRSIEILKILFCMKGFDIIIDYLGYNQDKELMIIEFSRTGRLVGNQKKFPKREGKLKKVMLKIKGLLKK